MKNLILILFFAVGSVYGSEKNVLIEVFTNSHCGVCPNAHNAVNAILQAAPAPDRINVIYYHMSYPYSDDPLYHHNPVHADARDSYYGGFFFTPIAFFDGTQQPGGSYAQWSGKINDLLAEAQSFDISIQGGQSGDQITLNIGVTKISEVNVSDLRYHVVVAEDVMYTGRNGISDHSDVMRYMVHPDGQPFEILLNETKNFVDGFSINSEWILSNLKIIVFVQSASTKKVYQAETVTYSDLIATSVSSEETVPALFELFQNYPNPFNPATNIKFSLPDVNTGQSLTSGPDERSMPTRLVVYDILGNEIATLIDKELSPGTHAINWNAGNLPSGVYIYRLTAGKLSQAKSMLLLK